MLLDLDLTFPLLHKYLEYLYPCIHTHFCYAATLIYS